jgi:hypothetical protein
MRRTPLCRASDAEPQARWHSHGRAEPVEVPGTPHNNDLLRLATGLPREVSMLSELFDSPVRIRVIRGGPAGVHIEGFAEQLLQRGYSKICARRHIRSAEHIVRWAVRRGLSPHDLGQRALKGFGDHLSRCRCGRYHCAKRGEVVSGARLSTRSRHRRCGPGASGRATS